MLSAEALKKGLPRYARVTASPRPAAGEIAGRVIWTGREERVMKSSQYVRGSYFYRMFFLTGCRKGEFNDSFYFCDNKTSFARSVIFFFSLLGTFSHKDPLLLRNETKKAGQSHLR